MRFGERKGNSSGGGTENEMADLPVDEKQPSSSMVFNRANRPITLKFEDVVYKITPKKECIVNKTKLEGEDKTILKGISGMVLPGELLAILGPSGSGKTTLLTALGGRLGGRLDGSITYNNNSFSNTVKRNTGFVTQDDILYPTLTLFETMSYTALLRLPNSLTKQEKISHADDIIAQLGLNRCRTSLIGGPSLRGISGGERKRVSIGLEMLINPSLLFLDEPTSGLDSTTAQRIVSMLWELATKGRRTVVMTIHQPSRRLFNLFHKVLLLSEGNAIYFGKGTDAMDYFANVGYAPSVAMNPSDFLLDLANGIASDNSQEDPAITKSALVSAFNTNLADSLKAALHENNPPGDRPRLVEEERSEQWMTTWWQQFSVLLRRGIKERKSESFSGLRIGEVLGVAMLAGLLWWQSDISHLQDQLGFLFLYTVFWGFYPLLRAIFTFPEERRMLEKERSSGMYRLSSYFMAQIVADLPMELILPTVFVILTYFMAGLKPAVGNFLKTLFSLLLSVLVSQGLGLALRAVLMDQKSATTLASIIMQNFLIAGGYYVQHVPAFIHWVKYLSISNYTYKLLLGSQYTPTDTYPCGGHSKCLVRDFPSIRMVGLGGQVVSVVTLVTMMVAYRLIAYWALTGIGVAKPRI